MILSFDSCILVEMLRNRRNDYRKKVAEFTEARQGLVVSSLVYHELAYGALRSQRPQLQLSRLDDLIGAFKLEDWTPEDGMATARLRAKLDSSGITIRGLDPLIAGQALARGWSVVTNNIRDFSRVPGLSVIDWTGPLA
ncbi:MAG: PilT protein domain protein [Caulobacteraceae bacterium]|nr:PilT protein domain protein [Caulobacteraceae bacterium]